MRRQLTSALSILVVLLATGAALLVSTRQLAVSQIWIAIISVGAVQVVVSFTYFFAKSDRASGNDDRDRPNDEGGD